MNRCHWFRAIGLGACFISVHCWAAADPGDARPDAKSFDIGAGEFKETTAAAKKSATGPLRVHPSNPRYLTDGTTYPDGSLRAVYLTGSHTWNALQDHPDPAVASAFDY